MRKEDKAQLIEQLVETLKTYSHFYLVDIEGLNAEKTSALRRLCFEKEIKLLVVKNTLIKKAIQTVDGQLDGLDSAFAGNTAVMFSNVGNAPAKVIKAFAADNEKPVLKGAGKEDLKRLLAIYFEQNTTTERIEDYDGQRFMEATG